MNFPSLSQVKLDRWDVLSIIFLVLSLLLGCYFLTVLVNPHTPLNPLPPPTNTPLPTPTPIQLEPTWTPTPTIEPTPTVTPRPTFTPIPTPTFFSLLPPTNTPRPTATPKAPFAASVTYIDSTIIHPELGCNWIGVGGSIVDSNNADITGIIVRLLGSFDGRSVDLTTVSGTAPLYGRSGFEFTLGTIPIASTRQLFVKLFDQAGLPLSENVYFNTYADCKRNLVLIRFKKVR